MRIAVLHDRLQAAGALPVHEARVLRAWTRGLPIAGAAGTPEYPSRLKALLPGLSDQLQGLARVRSAHRGADGSVRLLIGLGAGQSVETVLLPPNGVCISTQVGCAVGCVFCMTGRDGLIRQLGSAEIVAQVVLARARQAVRKVVFMGMGEPAHNLDNVRGIDSCWAAEGRT